MRLFVLFPVRFVPEIFRSWCFRVVVRMLFPMAFHGHGLSRRPVAVMYILMCICSIRRRPVSGWGYARNPFGRRQRGISYGALAGTQFLQEGKLTAPWSEKNIREQAFVTEYIGGCLRERGVRFTLEGPYTATAGELAHLKTDIRLRLSSVEALGDILQLYTLRLPYAGCPRKMLSASSCRMKDMTAAIMPVSSDGGSRKGRRLCM